MRMIFLFGLGLLLVAPSSARQADREADRYVGSRGTTADDGLMVEWRADRVVDSMRGAATVYGAADRYRRTSSGERYDAAAMTAAHESFPLDSMVRVTNPETGRRVVVRINDRLERGSPAVIRLSDAAVTRLGFENATRKAGDVRIELLSSRNVPAVVVDAHATVRTQAPRSTPVQTVSSGRTDHSDDSFTLQIGAFSTLDAARRLAADVEGAWVMQVLEDGQRVYRVYYGQYAKEAQARAAQERLEKRGRDSFLRRIPS